MAVGCPRWVRVCSLTRHAPQESHPNERFRALTRRSVQPSGPTRDGSARAFRCPGWARGPPRGIYGAFQLQGVALTPHSDLPAEPRPLHILVADDERMVRMAVRLTLEERGHRVEEAGDADEAFALAESLSFDALLIDVRMPGNGLVLLERLRALAPGGDGSPRGPADRAILLTADVTRPGTIEVIEAGQPHLRKPFRFNELVRLVERVAG